MRRHTPSTIALCYAAAAFVVWAIVDLSEVPEGLGRWSVMLDALHPKLSRLMFGVCIFGPIVAYNFWVWWTTPVSRVEKFQRFLWRESKRVRRGIPTAHYHRWLNGVRQTIDSALGEHASARFRGASKTGANQSEKNRDMASVLREMAKHVSEMELRPDWNPDEPVPSGPYVELL